MTPAGFAARLLAWYDAHARELPWRGVRDPWATWVSEVMLQQTRVEVVRAAYPRFLERFPTPAAFAAAGDDELQRAWRGLGYYRRVRLLREGARQVVERHGGAVPHEPEALGALAGVGDYTRGALLSIAFGVVAAAVDGNVERVLARHAALREDVKSSGVRGRLRELVFERIDAARPGDFNQALMDLGATVCTPRAPRCAACPVRGDCGARALGLTAELPVVRARRAAVPVRARAILVTDGRGQVLGARIAAGAVNEGQIELPGPGVLVDHPGEGAELDATLRVRYGVAFRVGAELGSVRHAITHHRITLAVHAAAVEGAVGGGLSFWPIDDPDVPWSTPSRKALRAAGR